MKIFLLNVIWYILWFLGVFATLIFAALLYNEWGNLDKIGLEIMLFLFSALALAYSTSLVRDMIDKGKIIKKVIHPKNDAEIAELVDDVFNQVGKTFKLLWVPVVMGVIVFLNYKVPAVHSNDGWYIFASTIGFAIVSLYYLYIWAAITLMAHLFYIKAEAKVIVFFAVALSNIAAGVYFGLFTPEIDLRLILSHGGYAYIWITFGYMLFLFFVLRARFIYAQKKESRKNDATKKEDMRAACNLYIKNRQKEPE